jgi:pimeloyl-ACP methyl ester carboxylesterase
MVKNTSDVARTQKRRIAHVIHYDLSYIVQGAEYGNDGAVVLLHDFPAGAFAWEQVIPLLASTNRAVYAIDMLGYGQSDHPWPADTSIWGHADCLKFFFDQLNLTNIILVGYGLGGGVAQVLATRLSRERVAALVLIDTIGFQYTFAPNWPLPDMQKHQDVDMPKKTKLEDLLHDLAETLPKGSARPDELAKNLKDYIEPWDSELGKEVLFQHIRTLIPSYANSVASDLKTLDKPTLIIWGEQDGQMPFKLAERLGREIPGSDLVTIPNAGHMILFDAPGTVARTLVNWMGKL